MQSSCQIALFVKFKIRKKVINSSTKCLISVTIAILSRFLISYNHPECLVDIQLAESCELALNF